MSKGFILNGTQSGQEDGGYWDVEAETFIFASLHFLLFF